MKKILVTGGLGFIGSNFIRHILKKYDDYFIVNMDKKTYAGNLENLKDVENNPRYRFYLGDICNRGEIETVIMENDPIDYVVHFGILFELPGLSQRELGARVGDLFDHHFFSPDLHLPGVRADLYLDYLVGSKIVFAVS